MKAQKFHIKLHVANTRITSFVQISADELVILQSNNTIKIADNRFQKDKERLIQHEKSITSMFHFGKRTLLFEDSDGATIICRLTSKCEIKDISVFPFTRHPGFKTSCLQEFRITEDHRMIREKSDRSEILYFVNKESKSNDFNLLKVIQNDFMSKIEPYISLPNLPYSFAYLLESYLFLWNENPLFTAINEKNELLVIINGSPQILSFMQKESFIAFDCILTRCQFQATIIFLVKTDSRLYTAKFDLMSQQFMEDFVPAPFDVNILASPIVSQKFIAIKELGTFLLLNEDFFRMFDDEFRLMAEFVNPCTGVMAVNNIEKAAYLNGTLYIQSDNKLIKLNPK